MYKDLGNFIFQETYSMMRKPQSLIIKLKGIGSWHLRKKRMDIVVNEWTDRSQPKAREEFESDGSYDDYIEKHQRYLIFQERLKEYDEYLSLKEEVKVKRRETQVLLEPDKGENGRYKSS